MLVRTRFGNTAQLHAIKMPGGARTQISFEEEPMGGSWSPSGRRAGGAKDKGGDEFYQLYTLKDGRLNFADRRQEPQRVRRWTRTEA